MPKEHHSGIDAKTAAGQCNAHKPCLRDAPGRFLGGAFVRKHKKETYSIDYYQVKNNTGNEIWHNGDLHFWREWNENFLVCSTCIADDGLHPAKGF
jgi:hypothetical protein